MDKYERIEEEIKGGTEDEKRAPIKYREMESGKIVAVKTMRMQSNDEFGIQCMTLRKISLLKEIDHDNVSRLVDITYDERLNRVQLMLEYADMDLKSLIEHNPSRATDRRFIRNLLEQVLHGLYCYHSINVPHGNINPTNVLIDCTNLTVKLTDLDVVTTPSYMAPELLYDSSVAITPASDMFSVGCIFAEMLTRKPLFEAPTKYHEIISISRLMGNFDCYTTTAEPHGNNRRAASEDLGAKMLNLSSPSSFTERDFSERLTRNLEKFIPDLRPSGIDLLSRMLNPNPSKRITVEQALKHPYIKSGIRTNLGSG